MISRSRPLLSHLPKSTLAGGHLSRLPFFFRRRCWAASALTCYCRASAPCSLSPSFSSLYGNTTATSLVCLLCYGSPASLSVMAVSLLSRWVAGARAGGDRASIEHRVPSTRRLGKGALFAR